MQAAISEDTPATGESGDTSSDLPQHPWSRPVRHVLEALSTSESGLSVDEVRRRRERYGPNRLQRIRRRSPWDILWDQVKSLIVGLLVVAMAVSLLFGHTVDAIAIAAVIVVNTAIGFFTELRAVRSMEALQKLAKVEARIRRDGDERRIPAEELVPGDIVVLSEGDVVPADIRLTEVAELEVDESTLTGESVPVAKSTAPVDRDTELAERTCMTYRGTAVTRGSGTGVVAGTGMQTELGAISSMVRTADEGETPLEKKLGHLGQRLVWLTVAVAAVVVAVGVLSGRDLYLMVETGIALAVAAIPEGLPIVATVALAHGMWRMLRRNAFVRRLSSVETLGATTVICTDKTGTLTENRMSARLLALPDRDVCLPDRETDAFQIDGNAVEPAEHELLRQALEVVVLCNGATLGDEEGNRDGRPDGDPLEIALLRLGRRAGILRGDLLDEMPQVREEPFDRETGMMATFHRLEEGYLVAVKGAPEAVVEACTHRVGPDREAGLDRRRPTDVIGTGGDDGLDLDEETRRHLEERSDEMAGDGLRVLSLAHKVVQDSDVPPYEGLCFLGHVGLMDPPRGDVREVIEHCKEAGIRVVMVTGDHPATARNVARAVGLIGDGEDVGVVRGRDFPDPETATDDQRRRLLEAGVIARVSPEQKLDLIHLHRAAGEVVAMTGDGVNDAPALRSADIGVAMGRRGTDVAREAADMVLQDDAFPTIVAAVEQGRVIFANIRKFVVYLLSGNVGEILAVGAAAAAGLPMPLLPLQILYINLLNDVFPALALGVGGGSKELMTQPPRNPREAVITRAGWGAIAGYGLLIAATVLGVFLYALDGLKMGETEAVTISFLTLSITRLVHVFNMRSAGSGIVKNEITRNPFVWGALALCVGLLALAVYVPFLADLLGVHAPGVRDWLLVAGASMVTLVAGQAYLAYRRRSSQRAKGAEK